MNRRSRSISKQSPVRMESFHKVYLKPGALARIRDSRVIARTHRVNSLFQISLHRASPQVLPLSNDTQTQLRVDDDVPCFAARIYGPRCPKRKRLVSSKPLLFLNPTNSNSVSDSPDPLVDSLSTDIIIAN